MRELPEIPDRLWRDLADAPLVPEDQIEAYVKANGRIRGNQRAIALTEKELAVVHAYAAGLEGARAAEALGISYESVKSLMLKARKKLGAKNTTHTVAEAIRRELRGELL